MSTELIKCLVWMFCWLIYVFPFQLLAPDIRRERNLVLQCVYHIVKENFFGVGSKKEDKEPNLEVTCDSAEGCVIKPETDGESCVPPDSSKAEETSEEKLNCKEPNHLDIKIQNVVVDPLKTDSIKECVIDDHAWAWILIVNHSLMTK